MPKKNVAVLPYQPQIETILKRALRSKKYRVYLFGSRAAGAWNFASDIDLGILAGEESIDIELSLAREALANSTIPLIIELVDLNQTSPDFKAQALHEGILLWTN